MRRYFRAHCCVFLITFAATLFAQDFRPANVSNARGFVGRWQASFQGKVFLTVSLTGDAQKLSGTVTNASIDLNKDGELTRAQADEGTDPVTSASVSGNRLRITTKSTDGSEDSTDYEIVLTGANEAELRIDVPPGITRPKPWKLTRMPQS